MNADILLMHFDRISEAPDAVAQLRRFILDLAVRGKLVEQEPNDEPATEVLKRIQVEKARLETEGRRQKPRCQPIDISVPFRTPASWIWAPLGELVRIRTGKLDANAAVKGGAFPFFTCSQTASEIDNYSFDTAAVLLAGNGDFNLKCYEGKFDAYQRTYVIEPLAWNLDYCFILLQSQIARITENHRGSAIPYLKLGDISDPLVPFPPLAEQHRIVAKVDELMALCDQLEAAKNEREVRRDRLVAASLHRICTAPAAAVQAATEAQSTTLLRDAARFHLDHLPRLTTHPEHIKQLRQTILNLAVRGALSDSADWTSMPLPLKSAATLQNGYAFKSEWFSKTGIRLLRNANVSHGALRWDDLACLPLERAVEFDRFKLSEGDVVLSLDRPFIVTGTKVARVCVDDLPCLLLQRVGRFQLNPDLLSADYLFFWIQSPHFTSQIDPGRSNGVPHISSKQVESALIVLPPLAEQHRIVAKVDELMALCDQLEAQLAATQNDSRRLLEAVLHEALAAAA